MTRVTDQSSYRRRRFIAGALGLGAFGAFSALRYGDNVSVANQTGQDLTSKSDGDILLFEDTGERLTTKHAATHYNNAYEFGWDKTDPYQKSGGFELKPWQVTFDGLCANPAPLISMTSWECRSVISKSGFMIFAALRRGRWPSLITAAPYATAFRSSSRSPRPAMPHSPEC